MNYLFLALGALIFVLGWEGTKQTFRHLSSLEERKNLLFRLGGFVAMSWWIHIIPSIILTIYMKKEGILASELLEDDSNRAIIMSLFMTPEIAFMIFAACWGGIWTTIEKSTIRNQKSSVAGGFLVYLWALAYFFSKYGIDYSLYIFAISAPIIAYSYVALCAPITINIRYYWTPFLLIAIITSTLFASEEITHSMVAKQLKRFGAGGGLTATISSRYGTESYSGKLILMTRESTYLRVDTANKDVKCIVHADNSTAIIGVADIPSPSQETKKNAAHDLCGPH